MKNKRDWDDIRKKFNSYKEISFADTEKCQKCVWADKESGKIFCSRYKCTEGKHYV